MLLLGGDKRDRTADLLNAIQALSRLVRLHTPLNRVKRVLQYAGHPGVFSNYGIKAIMPSYSAIIIKS